jgi:pimeloyl-ACP methyl ester carboxylesterase
MKHIYCISGLGADERVFSKFEFPEHDIHFIKWIIPEKNESIQSYAKKLIEQVHHVNPILIGLSFGGMMCIEIAKQLNIELIIIISSIKTDDELPLWMKLTAKFKLNRLMPMRSFLLIEPLEDYNLGVKTKEEKAMAHEYRRNVDTRYSNWAVDNLVNWKNKNVPGNLYHIHGTNDRIFSIKNIKPNYTIDKGGHLMIMNKSVEVIECINSILRNKI